jgi:hypothetical protein
MPDSEMNRSFMVMIEGVQTGFFISAARYLRKKRPDLRLGKTMQ